MPVQIIEAFGDSLLVVILVFFVYWVLEWFKRVFEKLDSKWLQPLSLLVGTILATGGFYLYDFRPLDLGEPRVVFLDFIVQGAALAALAGTIYDKFLDKTNS